MQQNHSVVENEAYHGQMSLLFLIDSDCQDGRKKIEALTGSTRSSSEALFAIKRLLPLRSTESKSFESKGNHAQICFCFSMDCQDEKKRGLGMGMIRSS